MAVSPKLALVTGAGSGIGKAAALALLEAGYQVACGYNANRAGAEAIRHPRARAVKIDIASRASIRRALAETRKAFRHDIDILVNNAALVQEKPFDSLTDADWDRMLAVNLRGAFILAQESLPAMVKRKWGRIVNITSIGGQWGGMRQVHYAAAKAGLINLTHSLARLYSPPGHHRQCGGAWSGRHGHDPQRTEIQGRQAEGGANSGGPHRRAGRNRRRRGVSGVRGGGLCHRPYSEHQWRDDDVMKTLLILGAGKEQVAAITAAKAKGIHTLVLDMNPDADGAGLADEFHAVSTRDREAILTFLCRLSRRD